MRVQDDEKKAALFEATVKLVNELGFDSSSVSRIAREAGISPATIYIYFDNKEDLLVSTYMEIKHGIGEAVLREFDESRPIRDILKTVWLNLFDHISANHDYYRFAEQFSNSPYSILADKRDVEKVFAPLLKVIERGIEQKVLKDVDPHMLSVFMWYPVNILANPRLCAGFELTREKIDIAFGMAWDALSL
jgi:AcrR family transcriptional regulator